MPSDLPGNYAGAFDGHLPFGKRPALVIVSRTKVSGGGTPAA